MSVAPGLITLVAEDVLLDYKPHPKDVLRGRHRPSSGFGERLQGAGRFEGESRGEDTPHFYRKRNS